MRRPQKFFQRRAKPPTPKKLTIFRRAGEKMTILGAPKAQTEIFCVFFLRCFRSNLRGYIASAKILGCSVGEQYVTLSFSNCRPAGAHEVVVFAHCPETRGVLIKPRSVYKRRLCRLWKVHKSLTAGVCFSRVSSQARRP